MSERIYHAILTRFNVRRDANVDPRVLRSEWLDARMKLFEQVTVPSIAAQTQLPDVWLVFFDEGTPKATRDRFEKLTLELPQLQAEYCRGLDAKICIERILRRVPSGVSRLLTTRLDNDDALNPRFVESVHAFACSDGREFLNPTHGLIVANGTLYRKRDYSSPFISLSEPLDGCCTVLVDQHQRLSWYGNVRQFALKDAWIQVVHGENLANQVRGIRVLPSSVSMNILPPALRESVHDVSAVEFVLDNSFGLVRRYAGSLRRRLKRMWADHKVRQSQIERS